MTLHNKNLNILIVEDNIGDFILIEDFLKEEIIFKSSDYGSILDITVYPHLTMTIN